MLSHHSWSAVVRGALLKALAITNPESKIIKVCRRAARRHYGCKVVKSLDERVHDSARAYVVSSYSFRKTELIVLGRFYDDAHGEWRIETMEWFIQKVTSIFAFHGID